MDPLAAELTLAEVDALREAGRRRLAAVPFPLAAFGLVDVGLAIAAIVVGRYHLAPFAITGFALAVWLSARALRRRARTEGVQVSVVPLALTTVTLCVGGMTASRAGLLLDISILTAVGPFLAQATGLWLLGRWADSDALAAVTLVMLVGSALIGSLTAGDVAVALQSVLYGGLLLAAARWAATMGPSR